MNCRQVEIINKLGMHARASAKFVNLAAEFRSEIFLSRDNCRVNGKSIMGIMMLAAGKGTILEICVEGADEEQALDAICRLIENRFGEEE